MSKVTMPKPTLLRRVMPEGHWYGDVVGYTKTQMEAYANERVREALEAAAKAVEAHDKSGREFVHNSLWDTLARESASRIRALIPKQ